MWDSEKKLNILYRATKLGKRPVEDGPPTPEARPNFKHKKESPKNPEKKPKTGMIHHIEWSSRHIPLLTLSHAELQNSLRYHRFFVAIDRDQTKVRFFNESSDINMLTLFLEDETPYNELILLIDGQVEQPYNVWETYKNNKELLYQKIISRQVSGHPRQIASTRYLESEPLNDTHQLWNAVYTQVNDEIEED